jgi:hypothetical protein
VAGAVRVEELCDGDLEPLAAFYRAQGALPGGEDAALGYQVPHLRWFLFANPARPRDVPRGWIARDGAGRIVGAKLCSPQRFRCRGSEFVLLHGGGYYVDCDHRGRGLGLLRRYLELGDRYSHFVTTANEASGAVYERCGGYPIAGSDHELIGVVRWAPIVEEWLGRRFGRPGLARLAAQAAALVPGRIRGRARGLEPIAAIDLQRLAIADPLEHAAHLTAVRDPEFLRWRYYEGPDATRELYVFEGSRGGPTLVGVNRRPRGQRARIRALMVLDLWGGLPADETPDLARELAARFAGEIDLVVFRGLSAERERALRAAGFLRRDFARPIGVCIDHAGRLPTREWYLVPADGDMGH